MWPDVASTPFLFQGEYGHLTVYDLVYNPLETRFLHSAKDAGATVIDGLDMFIFQGVAALEIWLQRENLKFDYPALRNFLIGKLNQYE
jgi:shikimate dehydrogenase